LSFFKTSGGKIEDPAPTSDAKIRFLIEKTSANTEEIALKLRQSLAGWIKTVSLSGEAQ